MLTLAQMSDLVINKIGQFDTNTVALSKKYLEARYRMIYDSYPWIDSTGMVSFTVAALTVKFDFPANLERIISIRSGGDHFLDPVDETFLIQADPKIFEQVGTPLYYSETPVSLALPAKAIRLYPAPDVDTTFLIFGKRVCPALTSDADTSVLRNCDNAIIAFAIGDMLERMRQYGKAQAKFKEAAELLESAKNLEKEQANRPRRIKHLTVVGNTLAEMTDSVCAVCGTWTPDMIILIREYLRRNYQALYDAQLWPESLVPVSVSMITQQVILPEYVDRVIGVRSSDGYALPPVESILSLNMTPTIFEDTGNAVHFDMLTPVGVAVLPPDAPERMDITSSSSFDTGKVFIRGESLGNEVTEEIILNGTTIVKTAYQYDAPITISKGITQGTINFNGETSHALLLSLGPNDREKKHIRLWLRPDPATVLAEGATPESSTALVLCKRKIHPLITDEDAPIITGCQNVLIAAAASDIFSKIGNGEQAKQMQDKATAALNSLIRLNTDQNAHAPRFIPEVEPSELEMCY